MPNAKILLAEDDCIAARHLSQTLPRMGYQLTDVVQSGEEVIKSISRNLPDIILMDITLGGKIDGICAVKKLQAKFDIPVIYITAHSDSDIFERAKQTKPYAYLVKPYEISQLKNAVEIALFKHTMERQLKESENRYRTLFEVSNNAMMLIDEHATITMVNKQFEKMTGCRKAAVENRKSWTDFFEESERSTLVKRLKKANKSSAARNHFETMLVDTKGRTRIVSTNVKKIPGTDCHIVSMYDISALKKAEMEVHQLNIELNAKNKGLNQEISLRRKVEKQLLYKATHDHLTGLSNRVLLFDRMKQAFAFEARHNKLIAVMILDLDNFKSINDRLGHLSGDTLLKQVARELQKCMRQYDTVGRLGGDEFVLIIHDTGTIQDIRRFAEKIQGVFQQPFDIFGQQTHVTTSIGIAVYPLHGSTIKTLLKKADMAMYVAKKAGRNTTRFYSDSIELDDSSLKILRTKRRISLMGTTDQSDFHTDHDKSSTIDRLAH